MPALFCFIGNAPTKLTNEKEKYIICSMRASIREMRRSIDWLKRSTIMRLLLQSIRQNTIHGEENMLTYVFLREENNEYFYEYYVNGDKQFPGVVALKKGERGRIVQLSQKDPFKNYAFHAISGININTKSGTVAWY